MIQKIKQIQKSLLHRLIDKYSMYSTKQSKRMFHSWLGGFFFPKRKIYGLLLFSGQNLYYFEEDILYIIHFKNGHKIINHALFTL